MPNQNACRADLVDSREQRADSCGASLRDL